MSEMYKGYPLQEVKEATKELRARGASDEKIKQLFEKAQHPIWQDTIVAMGIEFTMLNIYMVEKRQI